MATAATIISDAATLAGVVASGQGISAEHDAQYLRFFNMMLDQWANVGVDLGIGSIASGDELYIDDADLLGVTFNLAVLIAKLRRKPIDPDIKRDAMNFFSDTLAQHQPEMDQQINPILLMNTASPNILNDQ